MSLALVIAAVVPVVAILVVLAIASRRPDHFAVSRTLRIAATPEDLFPLINNLRLANTWNPYALREKAGTSRYSGPDAGVGARHDFAGPKSGAGFVEILESNPVRNVVARLVMTKPIRADNRVGYTLQPREDGADVTWAMSGRQTFPGKILTVFIDCDRMIGRDFDEGLANLRKIAETR